MSSTQGIIATIQQASNADDLDAALVEAGNLTGLTAEEKLNLYRSLALLDETLLSNARLRRRLKRLKDSLHDDATPADPNEKVVALLRSVATMAELQTAMDSYKLELPQLQEGGDGTTATVAPETCKFSYRTLLEALDAVLVRGAEWINKPMKRRISRLAYVVKTQVLDSKPAAKPAAAATPAASASASAPAAANAAKKQVAPAQARVGSVEAAPATKSKVEAEAAVGGESDFTPSVPLPELDSVEAVLALVKQQAAPNAATGTAGAAGGGDAAPATLHVNLLQHALDYLIGLVIEQTSQAMEAAPAVEATATPAASASTLTSQKRRLLRRALDRLSIDRDYALYRASDPSKHPNWTRPLLQLKFADVTEYLASGDAAKVLAGAGADAAGTKKSGPCAYYPAKTSRKPPRKYTLFMGQLAFYTTEAQLMGHIQKLMAVEGAEGAVQCHIRLLTDKPDSGPKSEGVPSSSSSASDAKQPKGTVRNCRGMAFVDFARSEDQLRCLKLLHKSAFNGRIINVERCDAKGGGKGGGGRGADEKARGKSKRAPSEGKASQPKAKKAKTKSTEIAPL